jgi:uncharacterized lipoprotein YmbA
MKMNKRINNMMRNFIFIILIGSTLMGCQQSPRKQYYLLSAPTSTDHSVEITRTLGLGPIEVAEYLQRSQVILNRDANSLQMADNAYWGEPLQKGITRVLSINLMNQKPNRLIETFPWRSDSAPPVSIRLQIHELQIIDGSAVINASWKLIDTANAKILTQQHFIQKKPCSENARDIAEAYSSLLTELAAEMGVALERYQ